MLRGLAPFFCPSGMLVCTHDGPIHIVEVPVEVSVGVGLLLDRREEALPEAGLAPARTPARDRAPMARSRRQITPGGASTEEPQDPVEDTSMRGGWTAGGRLVRREQGW